MHIHLTAILKSKPGSIPEIKAILENMVRNSRQESTCLQYDLHQGIREPEVFIFHEIWESAEALEQHNRQPYILEFIEKSAILLAGPAVIYQTD